MRAVMMLKVPGCNSAGRARVRPWRRGHAKLGESQLLAPGLQIHQQLLLKLGHVFL